MHVEMITEGTEDITKTKIRGVLALLKHALILNTFTPRSLHNENSVNKSDSTQEAGPVQLEMNKSILSFYGLRKMHG